MPIHNTSTMSRWWLEAEQELSQEIDFLFDRYEPTIVSGTAIYTLPDYCKSIRRITFLGKELSPLPKRNLNEIFQNAAQQGTPFWYAYDNVGQSKIQLFPQPNVNLAAGTDPWFIDIPNCCIVEFARISDGSSFRVPPFLRPQLLKKYVGQRMYQIEGPNQNMNAAVYYAKLWDQSKDDFQAWVQEMIGKPRKLMVQDIIGSNFLPAPPVLPISRYGESVETGM